MDQYLGPVMFIVPLLTFLGGLLLGNWLAISRDRRKEINEAAHTIHTTLLRRGGLDPIDADLYLQMLPFYHRWRFRRAVERLQKANEDYQPDPTFGTPVFTASAHTERRASIDALLRHTRWR